MTRRYEAAFADAGPRRGSWVVVDTRNGALAVDQAFSRKSDAASMADHLNNLARPGPISTCIEHAYGTTTRLSFQIKVF